jgi:hypothetical protein
MALPKLNTPTYELELPSTAEKIKYRPFLVREQKILMMAQESKNDDEMANAMGELCSACTFGKVTAENNPMFDMEYVFLKLRAKSVGEFAEINIICPDDGVTEVPVKINIDEIECQMLEDHTNEIQLTKDIKIILRYPYITDMTGMPAEIAEHNKVFLLLSNCITAIVDGDEVHQQSDISKKELDEFIDSLTTDQFAEVIKFFNTMPKVRHIITVTNPKTKKKSEVLLEGLQSFLG